MMSRFKKYSEFKRFSISENMQSAKDMLLKKYADEMEIKVADISPETSRRILGSKSFDLVKKLSEGTPNYALLYAQMIFNQGLSKEKAEKIKDLIAKYKPYLEMLPMSILKYGKVVADETDRRPGWERLETDLENLEKTKNLMKAVQDFRPAMKEQFKKETKENIARLSNLVDSLLKLEDKPGKDEDGNIYDRNAYKEFVGLQKKYIDFEHYPEFRDPAVAFSSLIKDAEDKIKSWKIEDDETESGPKVPNYILEDLEKIEPQGLILYNKNGYLAISARTNEAVSAIASGTNWCIKEKGMFSSITKEAVQYCILNANLDDYEKNYLVGLTIDKDGRLIDSADKDNQPFSGQHGKVVWEFIKKDLGYPKEMIDVFEKSLQSEVVLKKTIMRIFGPNGNNPKSVISVLIDLVVNKGAEGYNISNLEEIFEIVGKSLEKNKDLAVDVFKENGILSKESMDIFNKFVREYCTQSDIEKIKEETENNIKDAEEVVSVFSGSANSSGFQNLMKLANKTLEDKDYMMKGLSSNETGNLINQ
jgi:ferritin-like metal-binding protein YciE